MMCCSMSESAKCVGVGEGVVWSEKVCGVRKCVVVQRKEFINLFGLRSEQWKGINGDDGTRELRKSGVCCHFNEGNDGECWRAGEKEEGQKEEEEGRKEERDGDG